MRKPLRIAVYDDRYPTSFVTPRASRHTLLKQRFLPLNFVSPKLEGVTLIQPATRLDFVHAFNRIPINGSKFIISFESHLPRQFALRPDSVLARYMTHRIASPRCRRIIALSHFAKGCFLAQHAGTPAGKLLEQKLIVRHPNIVVPDVEDALAGDRTETLTITFVGAHFGRKGGCVAVKIAEKALQERLPIRVRIISSMQVGGAVWTDPAREGFFEPYLKLLELENVDFQGALPNREVKDVLRRSHFSILTTFGDTFGYSAIESMAEHTPVIATRVCALPEFIADGVNGISLPLRLTEQGEWWTPGYGKRNTKSYEDYFRDEVERLAEETLARLRTFLGRPDLLMPLRREARRTAERMFASQAAGEFFDALYDRVALETTREPALADPALDISSPRYSEWASPSLDGTAPPQTAQ